MSSCPDHSNNSFIETRHHFADHLPHLSSEFSSETSLDSIETSGQFDLVDPSQDAAGIFPFSLNIPTVVLRKHRTQGDYFVYMIRLTVRNASTQDGQNSRLEWTVGHRYTTLAKLHADLLGHSMNTKRFSGCSSTDDEEEDGEEQQRKEPTGQHQKLSGTKKNPEHRPLAHPCLPRPLPGLEEFQFPRKRVIPTIPALAAGRVPSCLKTGTDWITCQSDFVDYPVDVRHSHRVEQRRRALEQYLNRVLRLVWCVSQTREVANVINNSMLTMTTVQAESGSHDLKRIAEDTEILERSKSRLVNLLPILSESWN